MGLVWSLLLDESDSTIAPHYVWAIVNNNSESYFAEMPGTVKKRVIQWKVNRILEIRMALIEGSGVGR